jgi:putative hydrolase of the HAD superfamily
LLVDYGQVISEPFDGRAHRSLATLLDLDEDRLRAAYWQHRLDYDGGRSATDYWSRVAGRQVSKAEAERLNAVDVDGWSRVDQQVLSLLDDQRGSGVRLALLSNAPRAQAVAYEQAAWARLFEHLLVSSRLGLTKPDPAIFARALDVLNAEPGDVTFVDDRPENVAAAAALGIRAILFVGVDDLRRQLLRAP